MCRLAHGEGLGSFRTMKLRSLEITEKLAPFAPMKPAMRFGVSGESCSLAEVHLFTGPNGTGKSRLLSVLAASTVSNGQISNPRFSHPLASRTSSNRGAGNADGQTGQRVSNGNTSLAEVGWDADDKRSTNALPI